MDRPLQRIGGASSPGGIISQIISSLLLFALAYGIFIAARRGSQESPRLRSGILILATLGALGALFMIFVMPRWVPETPGSPGTLVGIALLWVFGGVGLIAALPAFLGAFSARPRKEEE